MASTEKNTSRKDKNQNIQVFVRLRPLNQREKAIRSLGVVEVVNNREVLVRQSHQSSHTKKFTFDKAFGPNAEQVEIYKDVVSPLIAEVLAGYNCTVFAYGQTGTGKTHTMVGERSGEGTTWQNDPLAGIIPRSLSQLFDELRLSNAEYTVRVSYLELYNEELFDLLSTSDDNSKLRIYEDVTRKGSTIVNGLEEITVYNKNEVYEIMAQGQERKKVASTLMNAQSSRSHTVFTIVVHMKENCPKGEELVKIGKLNLVDLAGSENISKAGSDNPAKRERARECVNINQSLLTLGRVITALVEKHPHIPYRESKLTRILQESLGGRTKTSIIATVSPGHKDLEETMSTLEYAHRAKNIQNKPEVNQKLTKQAILKDFAEEIDKLKRELTATREKNGVYLPSETYVEMTLKQEEQLREIQDLLLKKRAMEEERDRQEAIFEELDQRCNRVENTLTETQAELTATAEQLSARSQQCLEQSTLVAAHARTERQLTAQARTLLRVAGDASSDLLHLHGAVDKRRTVEADNKEVVSSYLSQAEVVRNEVLAALADCTQQFQNVREHVQTATDDHTRDASMTQEQSIQDLQLLMARLNSCLNEIRKSKDESEAQISSAQATCLESAQSSCATRTSATQAALGALTAGARECAERVSSSRHPTALVTCTNTWVSTCNTRVAECARAETSRAAEARAGAKRRTDCAREHHRMRAAALRERARHLQESVQTSEQNKAAVEDRISQLVVLMETQTRETDERLQNWIEEERRAMEEERRLREERMARHVASEMNALNNRLELYKSELEKHKVILAEVTEQCIRKQQEQLEVTKEETETEEAYLKECECNIEEDLKISNEYEKEFGDSMSAISAEMEAFGVNVVQVVEHANGLLVDEFDKAVQIVEDGARSVLAADGAASEQFIATTRDATAAASDAARVAVTHVADTAQATSMHTIKMLNTISERTCQQSSAIIAHQENVTLALRHGANGVSGAADTLRRAADSHAAAATNLANGYRHYSPTGNTPARRQFRYPRQLAATSPHERILARFRAAQNLERHANSPDSDCIVVESDEGRHTSDSDASESSVSEDSAVAMQ